MSDETVSHSTALEKKDGHSTQDAQTLARLKLKYEQTKADQHRQRYNRGCVSLTSDAMPIPAHITRMFDFLTQGSKASLTPADSNKLDTPEEIINFLETTLKPTEKWAEDESRKLDDSLFQPNPDILSGYGEYLVKLTIKHLFTYSRTSKQYEPNSNYLLFLDGMFGRTASQDGYTFLLSTYKRQNPGLEDKEAKQKINAMLLSAVTNKILFDYALPPHSSQPQNSTSAAQVLPLIQRGIEETIEALYPTTEQIPEVSHMADPFFQFLTSHVKSKNLERATSSIDSLFEVFPEHDQSLFVFPENSNSLENFFSPAVEERFYHTFPIALAAANSRACLDKEPGTYSLHSDSLAAWNDRWAMYLRDTLFTSTTVRLGDAKHSNEQILYKPKKELLDFLDSLFGRKAHVKLVRCLRKKEKISTEEALDRVNQQLLASAAFYLTKKYAKFDTPEAETTTLETCKQLSKNLRFPKSRPGYLAQFAENPKNLELIFDRKAANPFKYTLPSLDFLKSLQPPAINTLFKTLQQARNFPISIETGNSSRTAPNNEILADLGFQVAEQVKDSLFSYDGATQQYTPGDKLNDFLNNAFGDGAYTALVRRHHLVNKTPTEKDSEKEINFLLLKAAAHYLIARQIKIDECGKQEAITIQQTCYKGISAFSFEATKEDLAARKTRLQTYIKLCTLLQATDQSILECEKQRAKQAHGSYHFPINSGRNAMDNAPDIIGNATSDSMKKAYIWDCAKIKFEATKENIQREIERLGAFDQVEEDKDYNIDITGLEKELSSTATFLEDYEKEFPDMQNPILKIKRILSDAFKKAASKIGVKVKYSSVEATSNIKKTTSALFANAGQLDKAADAETGGPDPDSPAKTAAASAA